MCIPIIFRHRKIAHFSFRLPIFYLTPDNAYRLAYFLLKDRDRYVSYVIESICNLIWKIYILYTITITGRSYGQGQRQGYQPQEYLLIITI